VVHKGHKYYLKEAKKYGDILITIVARDSTIEKVK
jgi:cytidyltransferase-like protein